MSERATIGMTADDLKRARQALGLGRSQLARALGVRYATILHWEQGDVTIAHPRILALALDRLLDQRAGPRPPCEGSDAAPRLPCASRRDPSAQPRPRRARAGRRLHRRAPVRRRVPLTLPVCHRVPPWTPIHTAG